MLLLFIILSLCFHVNASIPNKIPQVFHMNSTIPLVVNKIISEKTKLPFAYGELPFVCKSFDDTQIHFSNLGHIFHGDRWMTSNFMVLCQK